SGSARRSDQSPRGGRSRTIGKPGTLQSLLKGENVQLFDEIQAKSRQLAEASERKWPTPELRIPNAAAQTRIVSKARIRLDSRKSVRSFKEIICVDISEFESYMPSHAVGLSASLLVSAGGVFRPARSMVKGEKPGDLPVQQTVKFE